MKIPAVVLLRYFETAFRRLQSIISDCLSIDGSDGDDAPFASDAKLDWHRQRVIRAQLISLEESLSSWKIDHNNSPVGIEAVQNVLRAIGLGDFSGVLFHSTIDNNGDTLQKSSSGVNDHNGLYEDQKVLLENLVKRTNDLARLSYSSSVLFIEWRRDRPLHSLPYKNISCSGALRGMGDKDECLDRSSLLEYLGLMISAVRLEAVYNFILSGNQPLLHITTDALSAEDNIGTVEDRLHYVQNLYWRALGWEPDHAMLQLRHLLSKDDTEIKCKSLMEDKSVIDTLAKYSFSMNMVLKVANDLPNIDDGTTRIINVSYSEKIVSISDNSNTIHSSSAPTSNTIDEHIITQQCHDFDIARKTTMLQTKLWEDFLSLSTAEQLEILEEAKFVQNRFMERVISTPIGQERVRLMQDLDEKHQKLLVIYKMWCNQNTSN